MDPANGMTLHRFRCASKLMNPLEVSVVIPSRNRIDFLIRAVASVAGRFGRLIVVDDGSDIPVQDAIETGDLAAPELLLLRNDCAMGAAAARNRGCQEVSTEWILFIDNDDGLVSGAEERYLQAVDQVPQVDAWFGGTPSKKYAHHLSDVSRPHLGLRNILGGCSGVLVRRTALAQVGGFDVDMRSMQDWDLWIRLFQSTKLGFLGEHVIAYEHESPDKITHNLNLKYRGLRRLLIKHRRFFTAPERRYHVRRLRVLRLLRSGRHSLIGNWVRSGCWPLAVYYTFRWRKFVDSKHE